MKLPHQTLDLRCCQTSGRNRYRLFQSRIARSLCKRLCKFLLQQPQHTDTVFELDIAVVVILRRQRALREQIPLITRMDKMRAMRLHTLLLTAVDQIEYGAGILLRKRF